MKNNPDSIPTLLGFEDIHVGDVHLFERILTQADISAFATLVGDQNPIHVDKDYGKQSEFKNNVIHGMLVGSLFSALIGMRCPGKKSLYLSQSLNFRAPIFAGDNLTIRGTVIAKNHAIALVTLRTEVLRANVIVVDGEAKVRVRTNG